MHQPATIDLALRQAAQSQADVGIRFLDRRERPTFFEWSEIEARARSAASCLKTSGVGHQDFVAIILPTCPGFLDAFFGCQWLGAVPVPMYPPVRLGRLDEYVTKTVAMISNSGAKVLITDHRVRKLMGQVLAQLPHVHVMYVEDLLGHPLCEPQKVTSDDLGLVQFSSGSTSAPKPVALTHGQLLANALRISDYVIDTPASLGLGRPSGVSWLPLYHDMGLIGCIFPALLVPGQLTLIPPELFLAKPAMWLRALSTYGATISPAPNFAYALCLERVTDADMEGCDLSRWCMALNGAEPISAEVFRAFHERFAAWGLPKTAGMPVYGLSEVALAACFSDPLVPFTTLRFDREALLEHRAIPTDGDGVELPTVGKPLPDYAVRIMSPEGTALGEGQIGEIQLQGPSVMRGYLGRDDQPFVEGWLTTGDLGFVWKDELYITGRAKDLLILKGKNHAPHDIEGALDSVEGIRKGCSAAVAEVGEHGERLLVFTEVRDPTEGQAEACLTAIRARCGVEPDLVMLLEPGTLPRTSSGKIRRAETLLRWQQNSLLPPQKVTPWLVAGALTKSLAGYIAHGWRRRRDG